MFKRVQDLISAIASFFFLLATATHASDRSDVEHQIILDLTSLEGWALSDLLNPLVRDIVIFRQTYSELADSTDLEQYTALAGRIREFAIGSNLPNLCSAQNPALCSEAELCARATTNYNGIRQWADQTAPAFVAYARSNTIGCSVLEVPEPMTENLAIEYLVALTEYVSTHSSEFGLEFAERYNSIRPILAGNWSQNLSEAFEAFRAFANTNENFLQHWEELQERKINEERELQVALRSELSSKLAVLNEWALLNIIDPKAAEIAALIRSADELGAQTSDNLNYFLDQANSLMLAAGILDQISEPDLTARVEALYSPQSIYLIANLTPQAENMYINLAGDVALYGETGSYCYISNFDPMGVYLIENELQKAFNENNLTFKTCAPNIDILVAKGVDLTTEAVLEGVSARDIHILAEISPSDREESIDLLNYDSQSIERDINEGSRVGYGLIRFSNNTSGVCGILISNEAAHASLLAEQASLLSLYELNFSSFAIISQSVEAIFRAIQRNECGAVYGQAADLHNLSLASQNNDFSATFLPIWFADRQVENAQIALDAEVQAQAGVEQALEERLRLDAEAFARRREAAAIEQQRLREENDLEFRAVTDRLQSIVSEAVAFSFEVELSSERYQETYSQLQGLDPTSGKSILHPLIVDMQQAALEGWEITSINLNREDFGDAIFNERDVQGVVVQIQIEMRNAIVGRYENYCRRMMLIDDEVFSMLRKVSLTECDQNLALESWRTENVFNSRWNVAVE